MRRLPLDFRDQYFGCEIELTGINRATAAQTLADLFGTRAEHSGGGYDAYRVKDLDGKEWKIVRDGSIHPECRRRSVLIGETYKVELNSPKLEYGEMEKLQEVVRSLRRAGGIVNDSCGMHVHVDASKHTPQSLKNVLSIMYSKEDILFAALKVNPARIDSYLRLNSLVPELLDKVDDKKMGFMPAVELSYIKPKNQRLIAVSIDGEQASPSLAQAKRLRELDKEGKLNGDVIDGILSEQKKEDRGVIISTAELEKYFGKEVTPAKMKEQIMSLLDDWKEKQPPELAKAPKKQELDK